MHTQSIHLGEHGAALIADCDVRVEKAFAAFRDAKVAPSLEGQRLEKSKLPDRGHDSPRVAGKMVLEDGDGLEATVEEWRIREVIARRSVASARDTAQHLVLRDTQ